MAKQKITDIVAELLKPYLKEENMELYNIEYVKEVKDWFLRIYIDKDDGVGLADCEKVSRYVSGKLDEEDPIAGNYFLEVSSPGMDRPLITDAHYEKYRGHMVDVALYKGINGKKHLQGKLIGITDTFMEIEDETEEIIKIPREIVVKTKLAIMI